MHTKGVGEGGIGIDVYTSFSSVQSLSRVRVFATPWITARQASLSITNSRSSHRLTSIELVMPSSHLILCHLLLLLPPILPSIRVFSNESSLRIGWSKNWSFSFSICPSNEHPGLMSFRMDWLDLFAVQGTLKNLLQQHGSKASVPLALSLLCILTLTRTCFRVGLNGHCWGKCSLGQLRPPFKVSTHKNPCCRWKLWIPLVCTHLHHPGKKWRVKSTHGPHKPLIQSALHVMSLSGSTYWHRQEWAEVPGEQSREPGNQAAGSIAVTQSLGRNMDLIFQKGLKTSLILWNIRVTF